jgi:hypothetical protein
VAEAPPAVPIEAEVVSPTGGYALEFERK